MHKFSLRLIRENMYNFSFKECLSIDEVLYNNHFMKNSKAKKKATNW